MMQSANSKEQAQAWAADMRAKGYQRVQVKKVRGLWNIVWSPRLTRAYDSRKNPTKAQKREKARKASVKRRVATALANFLKQANPGSKATSAKVTRLKGGGFTIRPIKAVKRR